MMRPCSGCGRTDRPIRTDGECFACHVRGIRFTFAGGGRYGRGTFHDSTVSEFIDTHVGRDRIRSGEVERV